MNEEKELNETIKMIKDLTEAVKHSAHRMLLRIILMRIATFVVLTAVAVYGGIFIQPYWNLLWLAVYFGFAVWGVLPVPGYITEYKSEEAKQ